MLREFGKRCVDLSQFQSVVRRICHTYVIDVCDLLAVRNRWCLVRDLFPFSHRVILRASRYLFFGFFLYVDVHGGIRQAGITNYSLGERSIYKCCDALPVMV